MNPETWTALLNLGAAGAVIVVVIYFLKFIRSRDRDWQNFFSQFRQMDQKSSQKVTEVLESLVGCVRDLTGKFDTHNAAEMEFFHNLDKQPTKRPKKNDTAG